MTMRTRVYRTGRMKDGRKVVFSGTPSEWIVYRTIKGLFKLVFSVLFFWIVIPVRLFRGKGV